MRAALQLRRSLAIAREEPVNVYDIAATIGVEVRFLDAPSLEGMFLKDPHPTVLVPSLNHRPRGRVSFTCAHEIGHFQLGHGTVVDEYLEGDAEARPKSDEEFAADTFASSLLMPRQAVLQRFLVRGLEPSDADAQTLFTIAGELDVGYETLLKHMCWGLELAGNDWLQDRRRTKPKEFRAAILGSKDSRRLVVAGEHWPQLPLDLEVGDYVAMPTALSVEVPALLEPAPAGMLWNVYRAKTPAPPVSPSVPLPIRFAWLVLVIADCSSIDSSTTRRLNERPRAQTDRRKQSLRGVGTRAFACVRE